MSVRAALGSLGLSAGGEVRRPDTACRRALSPILLAMAIGAFGIAAAVVSPGASATQVFTVTNTGDGGVGSLRNAITQANAPTQPAPYTIDFAIDTATDPGCTGSPKVCTIAPATDLPPILEAGVTLDAFTQPGASANTAAFGDPTNAVYVVVIDGSGSAPGANGIEVGLPANVIIRGLSVVGWRNGIASTGGSLTQVSGNYIGLLPDGHTVKANSDTGIVCGSGCGQLVVGSVFGPLMPADRNVIAGSTRGIFHTSDFNVHIFGNYIGTDASGTLARPNGDGIVIQQSLGAGSEAAGFNVVSGNTNHGILVASSNFAVLSSRIGTNAGGTAAVPNGSGITFTSGGGDIGKSLASDPNPIVSGNTHDGITFAPGSGGTFNSLQVFDTLVGTDINHNPLGNGGAGIVANGKVIVIGGLPTGPNTIANNGGDGIDIADPTADGVNLGANSIYDNAGLGISFRPGLGPTPNDPGDTDTGPNGLQNHPVLTSASVSAGKVSISGTLNSDPNTSYIALLFGNDSCDPSGFGEGKYYIGNWGFATDGSGNGSFTTAAFSFPAGVTVFTAFVTRGQLPADSSEFSNCVTIGAPPILQSAASRRVHGAAGTFDLPLSAVATNPTTEPRLGPAQTIVFTFDKPITGATAAITEGTATAAAPSFSGNVVVVGLTGVNNQQYVTVSLTNVASSDGGTGGSASVRIGFLAGDVNQNRVVSVADLGLVNAQLAQLVTVANFLKDVNASGTLTVADKGIANANLTRSLPAP
jgi:trimeric autotransporter adhesin